jgi:hypothetical protein
LKTLLWLMAVVANVFTGWELVDLSGTAMQTGELSYFKVVWLSVAYVTTFIALAKIRERMLIRE